MNYPLLTEYIEAIQESDNFDKLSGLVPVCNEMNKPIMSTGNFSVVFKMVDSNGMVHAVKCFTKDQPGRNNAYKEIAEELEYVSSNFVTNLKYYEKELFVHSSVTDETEFPIVVMDWVEGLTLQEALEKDLTEEHIYRLLYEFSRLSMWLISQPFSHGDIKPDNIIVRDDDTMVLVDYDGMYVPSLKGNKSCESGTPDYRHPLRAKSGLYNEHIDDFSIAIIVLSLLLLFKNPKLYYKKGNKEGLLFCENDFLDIESCALYQDLKLSNTNKLIENAFNIFEICLSNEFLTKEQIYLLRIPELFDETIVQGDKASDLLSRILWFLSKGDYIIHIDISNNIMYLENHALKLQIEPHNGKLAVSSIVEGHKIWYCYNHLAFKKSLLSIGLWDKDIEQKLDFIINDMVLYSPELMVKTVEIFFKNKFPDVFPELTVTSCGHTVTIVSKNGLQTIREQKCIYFMLANDTFQRNCQKFGIKRIIAIDGITGKQEIFNTNNLTSTL